MDGALPPFIGPPGRWSDTSERADGPESPIDEKWEGQCLEVSTPAMCALPVDESRAHPRQIQGISYSMELIPEWAPNVHPLVLHLPLALLPAAVIADLVSLLIRRWDWLRPAAVALYVVGGASAVLTYVTGTWAADSVSVSAEAQSVLTDHADLGWWTMTFFGIYALVRLGIDLWPTIRTRRLVQLPLFLVALGGLVLLYQTGDRGAEMVFRYGVGVQSVAAEEMDVQPGLTVGEEGWQWQPQSEQAWVEKMDWLEGRPESVQAQLDTLGSGQVSLALTPKAPILFVVPDTIGAVQVAAELNLDEFEGTVELVYNLRDDQAYDFLAASGTTVQQGRVTGGKVTVFDEASIDVRGWQMLRAVGEGTHFRGYLGEQLVTHPHEEEAAPGRVGLRLEGTGTLRIRSLRAQAL